ncbi:LysR substrate-binding domain-containing protein [Nonomuraea sp. NPDC050022]|uniref:LysR substrate-binding domain-containing protein n=1 Tax=Nonomuraea sp. NPDC050022 TaxID=3364358 RepID=UPI0037B1A704
MTRPSRPSTTTARTLSARTSPSSPPWSAKAAGLSGRQTGCYGPPSTRGRQSTAYGGKLRGRVTVGTMQGVWAGLHRALAGLRKEHPGVVVRLRQAAVVDIRQALRDGGVDVAVVALDRQQQRGLETRLLSREEMVLVTSAGREFPGPVTLANAARLPLVDFSPGWAIRHSVDQAFRAAQVERPTTFEVNDIVAASELVRHDLGVCIMPESIAARFPDLTSHRFAQHAPRWKVMVVRPKGEAPPAVAALLRHIA